METDMTSSKRCPYGQQSYGSQVKALTIATFILILVNQMAPVPDASCYDTTQNEIRK